MIHISQVNGYNFSNVSFRKTVSQFPSRQGLSREGYPRLFHHAQSLRHSKYNCYHFPRELGSDKLGGDLSIVHVMLVSQLCKIQELWSHRFKWKTFILVRTLYRSRINIRYMNDYKISFIRQTYRTRSSRVPVAICWIRGQCESKMAVCTWESQRIMSQLKV